MSPAHDHESRSHQPRHRPEAVRDSRPGLLRLQRLAGNAALNQVHVQRTAVHRALSSGGTPLPGDVRADMESRLGAGFGDVRIHTGPAATAATDSVQAQAFTSGSHIVLRGAPEADPHLLAHELTHVVQQRRGAVDGTDNGDGLSVSHPDDRFERAAEDNARRVMGS